LNEGHTVFIERKIAGRMFGEQLRHFLALDGWTELRNQVCCYQWSIYTANVNISLLLNRDFGAKR